MLNFKISGQVFEAETRIAIAGCRVRAFDKDVLLDDALGTALTDDDGQFTIVTSSARFVVLRIDDTVGFRTITGFRLREDFLASKFARGGVNLQSISGRPTADASGFQFSSVFQPGEEIWGALEPSALDPEHQSKMVALYLVPHKSAGAWSSDPSLEHLEELGGNAAVPVFLLQSGSAATNMQLLWPSAVAGEYDIIADFGNNMPNTSFVPDASFDQPLDVIDGYVLPGFRVVNDPAAVTDFKHVGSFSYDETAITVTDEVVPWDPYLDQEASFSDVSMPVRGVVYFPADGPDTTQSEKISTAKAVTRSSSRFMVTVATRKAIWATTTC